MMRTRPLIALALTSAALLAACGTSTKATTSAPASSAAPAQAAWTIVDCSGGTAPYGADAPDGDAGTADVKVTDVKDVPYVSVASGAAAPTELQSVDIIEGTGAPVAAGGTVAVQYCGVDLGTATLFDSSYQRGAPATFSLDQVIPGFGQGLVGMKTGGQRLLVIPGALAYGANPPSGAGIAPDASLIFVVDMVATQ